jgi:hypothetical protein
VRICWCIGELVGDVVRLSVVFNGNATARAICYLDYADLIESMWLGGLVLEQLRPRKRLVTDGDEEPGLG